MITRWIREFWPPVVALSLVALFGAAVWWTQRPVAQISAGPDVEPSTVTLSPETEPAPEAPDVRGTVTGPEGQPLAGVQVRLVGSGGWGPNGGTDGPEWEAVTDADGSYEFPDVSARGSSLRVLFSPDGEEWATTWHDGAWRLEDHEPLSGPVVDGELRVDASLLRAATIAGTVRGAAKDHTVVLERRVNGLWTQVQHTAPRRSTGGYEFLGLSPGRHRVVVESVASGRVYAPDAVRPKRARTTRVKVGQTIADVDVTVPPPVVVTGRLRTSTGVPLRDREIMFHAGWGAEGPRSPVLEVNPRTVRTDGAGRFRIELGTNGWYASVGNRCVLPGSEPWARVEAGTTPVQRDVIHDGVGSVTGQVTRPNGKPRRDVQVTFVRQGAVCGSSVLSNRKGNFRAENLEPGAYSVEYVWNTARGQFRETRQLTLGLFEDRVGVEAVLR